MLLKNFLYIFGIELIVGIGNKKHIDNEVDDPTKFSEYTITSVTHIVSASVVDVITFPLIATIVGVNENVNFLYSLITFIPISFATEIIFDFFHYWTHRLAHEHPSIYTAIHKTHHATQKLTGIVTFHQTLSDYIITNFIPFVFALTIVKYMTNIEYDLFTYIMLRVYKEFIEVAGHVNIVSDKSYSFPQCIWLPLFLGIELTQQIHHNHHKYVTCNYSKRFSLWDKLFGTYKK